jgi:predicted enzyme related to lactoylglutathione lyase
VRTSSRDLSIVRFEGYVKGTALEITSYENGRPCWADLGTPDVEAGAAFYTGLFGWEIEIGPAEMGHYSMAMVAGQPVAALADQQTPGQVYWTTYLAVDDVDATVAKVVPAGGTIVAEPMDVMTFGRMAIMADPGGAVVSLWQAIDHRGAGRQGEPGTMCWHELTTRVVEESTRFYREVVGLTSHRQVHPHGEYHEFHTASGAPVAGLMPMTGDMWPPELPNHWMVYFAVDNADEVAARCVELGGQAPVPPTDIPPGRFAVLNDPQGAHFSILASRTAP